MKKNKNAIILCSGGIDSVTTAFYVRKKLNYNKIKILFFDYEQSSVLMERKCAKKCSKELKAEFIELKIRELDNLSSSLLNRKNKMVKFAKISLKNTLKESKKWYVPCRNLIFLSYALALAETLFIKNKDKNDIFTGFKCEGNEHYPDTTQEFVNSLNKVSEVSCACPFKIKAPLIKKDKEEIISLGKKLGVNFRETWSCYRGKNMHCRVCLACRLRKAGFYWAGIDDSTSYQDKPS